MRRGFALFADLGLWVDVKTRARVHLWYAEKFGSTLAPYVSTEDAITTFPTTATAVGVQPRANGLRVFSPCGLSDLLDLIVRPNKKQITRPIYNAEGAEVVGPLAGPSRPCSWDAP